MCEFCSGPNKRNHNRDSSNLVFSDLFSSEAIEFAIRQASKGKSTRRAQKQQALDSSDDFLRNHCVCALASAGGAADDEEEFGEHEDEDGT